MLQRSVNTERIALYPRLGAKPRGFGKAGDELGPTIGITRIIERIDADEYVLRARSFCARDSQRQEDKVSRRDIGNRYAWREAGLWYHDVRRQRRTAETREIERAHRMAHC